MNNYEISQPIIFETLLNEIINKKLSHAYLFDISNYNHGLNFIMMFIKSILCPKNRMIEDNCNDCPICKTIDDNNYPDIEIINPDGLWIKKEQLDNIQKKLSTKSLYDKKKIYIVNGAEYLNSSSANSILKFLEEPESNIIAILITKNINNVLETIKSRCQFFSFKPEFNENKEKKLFSFVFENDDISQDFINNYDDYKNKIVEFINYYEFHGISAIIYSNKLWHELFNDKKSNIIAFNILILFYRDIVNCKIGRKLEYFEEEKDLIKKISNKNNYEDLYKKINIIINSKNKIKYNVNLSLNIDNMIIEMEKK